jgi:hypothetical protein
MAGCYAPGRDNVNREEHWVRAPSWHPQRRYNGSIPQNARSPLGSQDTMPRAIKNLDISLGLATIPV